ncbi:glutathione S-transferase P 1-like [Ambystoma mexicanum]|uniref:glutathione S-transferase P 1-like n=1 Tax=Ambystoma mexicanum TaxID=8296 RepID=UPI0037E8789E
MARFTITYFPVRGRAEAMRLLLADQGAEWKDEVVPIQEWMAGESKLKKEAVFGQLPKFQDGNYVLYQSNAILQYLGHEFDLCGKNNKEAGVIDMMNNGAEDFRQKFSRFVFTEYDTGKEKYLADLPKQLCQFETFLSKHPGGFITGGQISYADYNLLDLLHLHLSLDPDCLKAFPLLKAYVSKMDARPKIKAYMESDACKNRPAHPKEKR